MLGTKGYVVVVVVEVDLYQTTELFTKLNYNYVEQKNEKLLSAQLFSIFAFLI